MTKPEMAGLPYLHSRGGMAPGDGEELLPRVEEAL